VGSFYIFARMNRLLSIILLFCVLGVTAQEREMEIWNLNQISMKPAQNLSLKVSEKVHYSTLRSDIQLKYAELKVGYRQKRWMEYGAAYRLSSSWLVENSWENENRAMLFFDVQEPIHKFTLSFSNRFEYRSFKHLQDYFRHRQALKVDLPSLTSWGMQFYVSEESFYKFNSDGTHLARLYAGLMVIEKKHLNISTYYALQKSKLLQKWYTSDVLGLNLSFMI